jgi:general secretion pathway protein A
MYAAYFGLREPPFSITPDPRYLYLGDRYREALACLLYGIGEGGGFVQLTGEVGTGKTTLCRTLIEQVPPEVDVALVLNPVLTPLELVATVCDELAVVYPPGTTSLKVLVDALHRHLLEAHARGRRTVLIVDEAQRLAFDVLEQVRLLTNLETETTKLLQVILIGQPELIHLLDHPRLRQLAQRITARYHLLPLSLAESMAYIEHRLAVAGGEGGGRKEDRLFTPAAVRQIHGLAGGVPRLLNVICDRALLGAYAMDRYQVGAATARRAGREVLGRSAGGGPAARWVGATAAVALAVAGVWILSRLVEVPLPGSPRPGRPAVAASLASPPPAPPPVTLARLLSDPSGPTDKTSAFARLYAAWQVEPPGGGGPLDCRQARGAGLGCLVRTGTWTRLRRFDLPAVLELVAPDGDRHYAALTALDGRHATLDIGGRPVTLPLAEVDPFWHGAFTLLWRPPALSGSLIAPGTRSRDVEWLRRRLAAVDDGPADGPRRDFYDDELKARVVTFQRSRSLWPDGVVGEETLTHLTTAVPGPGIPRLVPGPG